MTTPAAGHTHKLPPWLLATLIVIVLGLVGGTVIVSRQAMINSRQTAETNRRLSALEDYVGGKGAQRDAENARLNQRINDAVCSVLDQLPAGGRLDVVRQSYGCGPGVPDAGTVDRSTPRAEPTAGTPAGTTAKPTAPAPAATTPSATPSAAPPRPTTPAPTTAPPTPTGGVLCTLLGLFCPPS